MQKPDQVFRIKMLCLTRFILTIYSKTQINRNFHTPRPNVLTNCTNILGKWKFQQGLDL